MNRITLIAALKAELRPLLDRNDIREKAPLGKGTLIRSTAYDLLRTGVGRNKVLSVYTAYLEAFRPAVVINLGLAGALSRQHKIGEIYIIERYGYGKSMLMETDLKTLFGWGRRFGGLLTVDAPVLDRKRREELFDTTGLSMVDMEGYHFAALSRRYGIPFFSIKIISDRADRKAVIDFSRHLKFCSEKLAAHLKELIKDGYFSRYTGV